jgi:hypothetical protein
MEVDMLRWGLRLRRLGLRQDLQVLGIGRQKYFKRLNSCARG